MPTTTAVDKRQRAKLLADLIIDRPTELDLTPADFTDVATRLLGHPVDPVYLQELVDATTIRDAYRGTQSQLDAQQARVDAALEAIVTPPPVDYGRRAS